MNRRNILILLTVVCLVLKLAILGVTAQTEQPQSLASFYDGAIVIEKSPAYSDDWSNLQMMDGNPKTGWCCPQGEISNNAFVIELAEKSIVERVEFDTAHADGAGRPLDSRTIG